MRTFVAGVAHRHISLSQFQWFVLVSFFMIFYICDIRLNTTVLTAFHTIKIRRPRAFSLQKQYWFRIVCCSNGRNSFEPWKWKQQVNFFLHLSFNLLRKTRKGNDFLKVYLDSQQNLCSTSYQFVFYSSDTRLNTAVLPSFNTIKNRLPRATCTITNYLFFLHPPRDLRNCTVY